jgi:superfamily II DNA/RNA helicase
VTKTFRDLGVHEALCEALGSQGITHPFPIQELTLPLALDGNDLIGQARTGTGKTLAFGLPLLQRIDPKLKKTQALVIAPTRELANQVHEDLSIGKALGLTSICVYGGVPYEEQIDALQGGVHIVVGTPGRLLDHLNRRNLDLSNVTQLVLDEADEMLDMGFLPDVERLIEACQGEDRHTMLFSATMPTAIVRLARRYMKHPTFTRADHEQKNTAPLVTQHFFQVHRMDKPRVLARILQSPGRGGVYVFVRTKHMADRLVNELEELGAPAIPIHGDLRQTAREKNLERFRSGKATVLVATEVAARGLDVGGVTHVVNYDCPDDEKMYLHRIGRTARAGEAGVAITFAEFNEADRLNVIRKAVGATDTEVLPIFSTSQELIDLFDLPEGKPWDAQVKAKVDEERDYQQRRRSGGGDKRTGRTDGRSKNSRDREGRGDRHDAKEPSSAGGRERARSEDRTSKDTSRERSRGDDRTTKDTSRERSRGDDRTTKDTSGEGGDGAGRDRVRTRTRTRTGEGSTDRRDRGQDDAGDRGTTRTRERARDGGAGDDRRGSRERSREHGDGDQGGGSRDQRRGDAGSGEPRKRARAGGSGRSESGGKRSGAAAAPDGDERRNKGDDGSDQRGSGRRRSGGRSSGSRSGGSDRNRSGGGNGGRSGSRSGDRSTGRQGSKNSRDQRDTPVVAARAGAEARGEGQPQLARRVKVEKLP